MKSQQLIADALSDWRVVRDAPDLAHDLFGQLDEEEVLRLAMRGLTDEVRAALRRKNAAGVPVYASVEKLDAQGRTVRLYKQTEAFDVEDYRVTIRSYVSRANAHVRTAKALAKDCEARLHVVIPIPGLEAA